MDISEEEYFKECKRFLTEVGKKDISKDIIELNDGDLSCVMSPNSEWFELFGGQSIYGVALYVANKMGKSVKFIDW
jgi:hypothetical protein